jgi:hypothetical protein
MVPTEHQLHFRIFFQCLWSRDQNRIECWKERMCTVRVQAHGFVGLHSPNEEPGPGYKYVEAVAKSVKT